MTATYRFGPYRLDAKAEILFRGAEPVGLGQRAIALLLVLVERAGEPVSKDTLIEAAWPEMAIEDSNLTVQIAALRRVFAEDQNGERWIETLSRRGYRYIGPAVVLDENGASATVGINTPRDVPEAQSRLSIVVLPFVNRSSDPEQEFLADILTEELTAYLSRIPGSFVIASSTAFTYQGKALDIKKIGQELDVCYVLEGSLQARGDVLRVNAKLINAETGTHLWAERFDAARGDLLDMQDEIVTRIARTLQIQLSTVAAARIEREKPNDKEAEVLAMRAEALFLTYGISGREETSAYLRLCEDAIERDPENIRALSIRALALAIAVWAGRRRQDTDMQRAQELCDRALAIEPNHYLAHHAKGALFMISRRFLEAIVEDERALELNPVYIGTYATLALSYALAGGPEKGLVQIDKAIRLSPRDPLMFSLQFFKGLLNLMLREDEKAIEGFTKSNALNPAVDHRLGYLAAALALTDHAAEAHEHMGRYLMTGPMKTIRAWKAREESADAAYLTFRERLYDGLRRAGMPEN